MLLVRLAMVVVTLAVVYWIGWTIPASYEPEPPLAARPIEADPVSVGSLGSPQTTASPPAERRHGKSSRQAATVILDVNQATTQELERLPGIGPVLAGRIVEYREARGAFQDIEQLRRVRGIGYKTFERLRGFVAVGVSASKPAGKAA